MCVQSIFADNVYFIFKMDEIVAAIEMDVRYSLSVRIVLNGKKTKKSGSLSRLPDFFVPDAVRKRFVS